MLLSSGVMSLMPIVSVTPWLTLNVLLTPGADIVTLPSRGVSVAVAVRLSLAELYLFNGGGEPFGGFYLIVGSVVEAVK